MIIFFIFLVYIKKIIRVGEFIGLLFCVFSFWLQGYYEVVFKLIILMIYIVFDIDYVY